MRLDAIKAELQAGDLVWVRFPSGRRTETTRVLLVKGWGITEAQWTQLEPLLEPVGDGMFGATQTWRWKG